MTTRKIRTALFTSATALSLTVLIGCGATSTSTAGASAAVASTTTPTSAGSFTASTTTPDPPTNAMSSAAGMPMPAAPAGPYKQADITFAQQMTIHHRSAVAMADLAPTRASSTQVKTLAKEIKAAQDPEIREMAGWLAAWVPSTDMNGMPNTAAPSGGGMGGMGTDATGTTGAMPGMMTDAQMGQLTAATGTAFDKLFLQMMIVHHQGALTMAQTETAQGQNPAALALAKSITTSQSAQITQMKTLLAGR